MTDAAPRLRCGSSAIVRRCARDGYHRHLCSARGSCPQSVDGGVRKSQPCNSPARPEASCQRHWYRPAYGSSSLAPRHDLDHFAPHSYCPRSFPRRRIAPVSRRPRNVIPGEWTAVRVHHRLPSQCEQGGRSPCWARQGIDSGELNSADPLLPTPSIVV